MVLLLLVLGVLDYTASMLPGYVEPLLERCGAAIARGQRVARDSSRLLNARGPGRRVLGGLTSAQLGRLIQWHRAAAMFAPDSQTRRVIAEATRRAQRALIRREFTVSGRSEPGS